MCSDMQVAQVGLSEICLEASKPSLPCWRVAKTEMLLGLLLKDEA